MSLRRWLAGITAIALVGVAAPAHAATTVTVPKHTSDSSTVRLEGASESGFMLAQDFQTTRRLVAGAPGTTLSSVSGPAYYLADAKGSYGWYHRARSGGGLGFSVSRVDLKTKVATQFVAPSEPLAYTPDGWLTTAGGALQRVVAGGATTSLFSGINTFNDLPTATSDATGAAVLYTVQNNGVYDRYVGLVTYGKPGVEVVWKQSQGAVYQLGILDVTITPTTITWTTSSTFNGGGLFVHQRARSGGPITTTALPSDVSSSGWAAAGSAAAFLVQQNSLDADPASVKVLNNGAWHTVSLPGPGYPLRSSGTRFHIGVSGKNSTAGVYGFGATGAATRVAWPPAPPAVLTGTYLSAGYLTTADDAVASILHNGSLWRRPVSGSTSVTLGAETRLTPSVSVGETADVRAPVIVSAARGVVRAPGKTYPKETPYQLTDRGVVVRTLPQADQIFDVPHLSGPYVSVGGRIYRTDGTTVLDLGTSNNGELAMFGRTLIYQSAGKVLLRDLEKPAVAPTTLAASGICDQFGRCAPGLAAWYDKVAWGRSDGKIVVRTLSTGVNRVVDTEGGYDLQLSDNALTWRYGDDSYILDLGSAGSTPVTLPGFTSATVDSHLVAGIDTATNQAVVKTLPFGSTRKTPVRLIGTLAPAAFTPGTWSPQFDLTKPSTAVKLTIKSGSTTVRTLTGTASDGSIRDLVWDGKNTAGTRVANGAYSYQLTASATDGEGALTGVTGTVTVR